MEEKARKFLTDFGSSIPSEVHVCAFSDLLHKVAKSDISRDQKRRILLEFLRQSLTPEQFYALITTPKDSFKKILTFPSLVPDQPDNPMVEKEVGPEGGVVELENVARLEIPPGALDKTTLIKMYQVLTVESTEKEFATSLHAPEGEWLDGYDFITPVVRLEPFELKLKEAALLHLPIDAARVGNNDLSLIQNAASSTAKNGDWSMDEYWDPLGSPEAPAPYGIQRPIKINTLVYFAKQFPTNIHPNQGVRVKYKTLYLPSPEQD